jgi:beta-glucosidase-like glycosyl hydrolase
MRISHSFCICLASLVSCLRIAQETPKYLDPSAPIEQRIDDLLPRMTVAEKVTQISDDWGSAGIARLKVPSLLKTEGLHSQSYSTGATIFPQAIGMAATFDPALINKIGRQTALESESVADVISTCFEVPKIKYRPLPDIDLLVIGLARVR